MHVHEIDVLSPRVFHPDARSDEDRLELVKTLEADVSFEKTRKCDGRC
jgi:hypothetical protein